MISHRRLYLGLSLSLIVLTTTVAAIDMSWVQQFHNADSVLVSLIGIDRYTPFYWGENRFGQPAPLLMSFIPDYTANLFAQTALLISASLGCVVLFNFYFLHSFLSRLQRMAVAMSSIVIGILILAPISTASQVLAVGAQPYTPSLFLTLLAMAFLFRTSAIHLRMPCAFLCLSIAFWLNISIASIALGLILILDFDRRNLLWQLRLQSVLVLTAAIGINLWFARRYSGPRMFVFQGKGHWFFGLHHLWNAIWPFFFHQGRLLAFLALVLVLLIWQASRHGNRRNYSTPDAFIFLAAAVCYALATAKTVWVGYMGYDARYWTIPVMLFLLVVTGWVSGTLVRLLTKATGSEFVVVMGANCLLAIVALGVFGVPSYARAKGYLAESVGHFDADERALGCTHLLGDYWVGWTSVFYREATGGTPIYAIAHRSEVTRDRWDWASGIPRTYCGLAGDPDRERIRRVFGLPVMHETARSGTLRKLEVTPVRPASNNLEIRDLNGVVVLGSESEMADAVDALVVSGDRHWMDAARLRLPSMEAAHLRLDVASQLARAGVFDGWAFTEATVRGGDTMLSFQAINHVESYRDMKELDGQPFDLSRKLVAMRAHATARDLRDELSRKITQIMGLMPSPLPLDTN